MRALVLGPTGVVGDAIVRVGLADRVPPGYICPTLGRERPYWGDPAMKPLMPFRSNLSRGITDSTDVARAVLYCGSGGIVPSPATNRDIAAAASAYVKARTDDGRS